ncbi:hypothetical protein B0A48_16094 [Cryoendolithus antarcticus]|uniref:C3H1-type domain-containing protein n=1 Tax=Cryoendolithus antarcticus TaxID=1507870 RepID=A0A1V8SF96_9PEZI|nr:hypothetical protein B0A48_16094 [Cryoendolithus antarcticus]
MSEKPPTLPNGSIVSCTKLATDSIPRAPAESTGLPAERKAVQHTADNEANADARKEDKKFRRPVKGSSIGTLNLDEISQALRLVSLTNTFLVDVVFVCIDCEAWEFDSQEVTEIGVAVLDPRDLRGSQPGVSEPALVYNEILTKLKHAHYRPVEYALLGNKRHVPGCPEAFGFGTSTWIRLGDGAKTLQRIFDDPARLLEAADFATDFAFENRSIIFVAHGPGGDIVFMNTLGFDLKKVQNIAAHVDTEKAVVKNIGGLVTLLASVEINPVNLHNAGNDAAYTLQAMIKAAVLEWAEPKSVVKLHELLTKPDDVPEEPTAPTDPAAQTDRTTKPPPRPKPKRKPKQPEVFDHSIVAPVAWGGTALPGDEINLAIPFKAAKNAAFVQRERDKVAKDAAKAQKVADRAEMRAKNPNGGAFIEMPSQQVMGAKVAPKKICRFFQIGDCRFGINCRYVHEFVDQTRLAASVSLLELGPKPDIGPAFGAVDLRNTAVPADNDYDKKTDEMKRLSSRVWEEKTLSDSEDSEVVVKGRKQ